MEKTILNKSSFLLNRKKKLNKVTTSFFYCHSKKRNLAKFQREQDTFVDVLLAMNANLFVLLTIYPNNYKLYEEFKSRILVLVGLDFNNLDKMRQKRISNQLEMFDCIDQIKQDIEI